MDVFDLTEAARCTKYGRGRTAVQNMGKDGGFAELFVQEAHTAAAMLQQYLPPATSWMRCTVVGVYSVIFYGSADGSAQDPSAMAADALQALMEDVDALSEGRQVLLVPPSVTGRMEEDCTYATFIWSRIEVYTSETLRGPLCALDEAGVLHVLDRRGKEIPEEIPSDGEDYWEAREARQDEYIEYLEEARMEHALEVTRAFAALRGFAQGFQFGSFHGGASKLLSGSAAVSL